MPSIYDAIKADHRNHRALLEQIADCDADAAARRRAWENFYYDVKSHAAAEEETFYSRLMTETWGQDAARHSVHEHQELDDLMEEINGMEPDHPSWSEKFGRLRHDYEHHMDEEEEEVFARAREVITKARSKASASVSRSASARSAASSTKSAKTSSRIEPRPSVG